MLLTNATIVLDDTKIISNSKEKQNIANKYQCIEWSSSIYYKDITLIDLVVVKIYIF